MPPEPADTRRIDKLAASLSTGVRGLESNPARAAAVMEDARALVAYIRAIDTVYGSGSGNSGNSGNSHSGNSGTDSPNTTSSTANGGGARGGKARWVADSMFEIEFF
jgi:hypothetical protein